MSVKLPSSTASHAPRTSSPRTPTQAEVDAVGEKQNHEDAVPPQRDVFHGHDDLQARAQQLGFDAPLPAWVERFADRMRLHTPDQGKPFLMDSWGELVHPQDIDALPKGGMELPPVRVASDELRVFVLGDSGTNNDDQRTVANTLLRESADDARAPHFAIHVGDGIYNNGVQSVHDPKFEACINQHYGAFGRPVYYALGNHDYGSSKGSGNVQAVVDYANAAVDGKVDSPLTMPGRYYSYSYAFGDKTAKFFTLDTNTLISDDKQQAWLESALKNSDADFNIIVGHHPILSDGAHGDQAHFQDKLLPLVDKYADLYVCGHEHDQQILLTDKSAQLLSGAAGEWRDVGTSNRSLFSKGALGFSALQFSDEGLRINVVDGEHGNTVFSTLLEGRKQAAAAANTTQVDVAADKTATTNPPVEEGTVLDA